MRPELQQQRFVAMQRQNTQEGANAPAYSHMSRTSPWLDAASLINEFSARTEILKQRILELNDKLILEAKKTKTIETDLSKLQSTMAHYLARMAALEGEMYWEKQNLEEYKTAVKIHHATGEEKMNSRLQDVERSRVQDREEQDRRFSEFKAFFQETIQQEIERLHQQTEQRVNQIRQWVNKAVSDNQASLHALELVAFKEPVTRARAKLDKAFAMNAALASNAVKAGPPLLPAIPKRLTRSTAKPPRKENLNKVSKCRGTNSKKRKR